MTGKEYLLFSVSEIGISALQSGSKHVSIIVLVAIPQIERGEIA